jgi:putative hydrolase of the HAD superfamily
MRFEAVVFDLFGTLVPGFSQGRFEASLAAMAGALGVSGGEFIRQWSFETWEDRATGRFDTIEANVRQICEALGQTPDDDQVAEAVGIRIAFTREILTPRGDAIATLKGIRASGRKIGLISDCSAEVPALWPEIGLESLIDVAVFSCVAGMKKPDPRNYLLACDGLGTAPEKCLYVGDGFSQELAGASRVGMTAVLIAPVGEETADTSEKEGATWSGPVVETLSEVASMVLMADTGAQT